MKKYDGWVIFSDVDGTISTWEFVIPQKNLDAIKYFTDNGGRFAVATGRGLQGVAELTVRPLINFPCILTNGAVIYDLDAGKCLYMELLPPKAREIAKTIRRERPELRIMVWGEEKRFEVGAHVHLPRDPNFSSVEELDCPWTKIVIYVEAEERVQFMEWLEEISNGEVSLSSSSPNFVEIMPYDVSKGAAVQKLIELKQLDVKKVAVIGDFLNDMSMLTLPGVNPFCPLNAHEDVKAICPETLCSVEDGAIAHLISLL